MNKLVAAFLISLFVAVSTPMAFADQDPTYPFKVKIGGQEAVKSDPVKPFAVIDQAVANDSEIEVAGQGQVIINAVQCDEMGNPVPGKSMAVLMFKAPKGSLSKTMDGKKLESGKYLANVVANGATSRVVFQVK